MHLLNPQLFIHAHLFSLQSPSLKEKDLQNILASPVSEGFCRPDSTAAARQFPPCPTPANVNPDYLYRKSLALPQNCPKLQLLQENVETLLKTMGVKKVLPGETMAGKCQFLTRNSQKQSRREVTVKSGLLCHWTFSTHSE